MERFEIEEIASQDKNGIVFRGIDSTSGNAVAIRRFFPFGQNGGGLDAEESTAFGIAANRLSHIHHLSLRSVIHGGVDPIDGMPFIATEWIEGVSLTIALADQPLDPALVIDVLRHALEVSVVISHVLGEEAVWVETEVESIVVGSEKSGRGFTFWISPFKWLGNNPESRKLSSIVALGEELTGWKGKSVGDQAGYGLGGYLKWLKSNPDVSLREALESLAACTGNDPPLSEASLVRNAIHSYTSKPKSAPARKKLMIAAICLFFVSTAALVYLHKTSTVPPIATDYAEQQISQVISDRAAAKPLPAPANQSDLNGNIYSPEDTFVFQKLDFGAPAKLRGVLASLTLSKSRAHL
ncbi:MAG: hypothetical protein H7Y36_08845, partial [Armatimonadetes bacterium]|nr:hypothetical protein [Akkermansiaceae bacterium]